MSNCIFNKYIPGVLAVLLSAVLCFGSAVPAFAMEGGSGTEVPSAETQETEDELPRVTSGTCGESLSWNFSAGTLAISGSGAMTDFAESTAVPWYGIRDEILNVVIPDGITNIGSFAFYECENITSATVPESVKKIGKYSFAHCEGMKILNLGSRIEAIAECAFSDCYKVTSLKLPSSLKTIGFKAFYRLESIPTLVIPSGVVSIGTSAFGYCVNLVSVNIQANITVLPEYMFYGCEKLSSVTLPETISDMGDYTFYDCGSLNNVYYDGESIPPEELEEKIGGNAHVSEGSSSGPNSGVAITDNGDGTVNVESTTVTEGEDSTVSTTTETTFLPDGGTVEGSETEVVVTIEGENGWNDANEALGDVIDQYGTEKDGTEKHLNVELYIQESGGIDSGFIETIAGKDITVTITTENGSVWVINGKDINVEEFSGNYSLAYVLEAGSAELCEKLGASSCFVLRFLAPAEINAEVMIRIGGSYARRNATLFQDGKEVSKVQSAVVDNEGYAHFYLGSVTEKTEYYIGMDVAGASEEAIVPQNMLAEYGNPEYIEPIKYEITGRTSSWGMNLGQVMSILAVVMVSVILVVGAVMFFWNRQRLKNGYIPQMDDDE